MKILLTNPVKVMVPDPSLFGYIQPIHLMYVASYLEREGHEVKIFDTVVEKSVNKYINTLKRFDPDIVGIGSISATIYSAWDTAELVKKYSDAKVVFGGDHVTFLPGETLYCCPFVDYVVRGEGEVTTADLLKHLQSKKRVKDVKGVSYKKDKRIVHNPPRPWIKNLDDLPYPAWHLVDMYKYVQMVGRSGLFVSSRGCSRGCSFCISSRKLGLAWRSRSAESVVDEMIQLASNYPKLDNVVAIDDNFMWDRKRVEKICNLLIKEKFDMPWICQGRADTIVKGGKKLVDKMFRARCMAIQIGVESPFENRLKAISKGINKSESVQAVKLVKDADMVVRATFLFGFEDETKEKMKQTFDFARKMDTQGVQFAIMTPFPGTPYFEEIKHKLITHDWRRFTVSHQFLDYGFDIEKYMARFFLKYHLRPHFLKVARDMNINQFTTAMSFIYPMIKSVMGTKGDYLYDFGPTKWLERGEEYWQDHILKTNLMFEETWYYDKPKIDPLPIPYEPIEEIYPVVKEVVPVKLPAASQWVRMG